MSRSLLSWIPLLLCLLLLVAHVHSAKPTKASGATDQSSGGDDAQHEEDLGDDEGFEGDDSDESWKDEGEGEGEGEGDADGDADGDDFPQEDGDAEEFGDMSEDGEGDDQDMDMENMDGDFDEDAFLQEGKDDELANFVQFQVEEALEMFESNDAAQVARLFSSAPSAVWNGKPLSTVSELEKQLNDWLKLAAHTRFVVTSRIHETNGRAQFTATCYQVSKTGCPVVVDGLYDLSFDKDGKLSNIQIEWNQSFDDVVASLSCASSSSSKAGVSSRKATARAMASTVAGWANRFQSPLSSRSVENVIAAFATDAVLKTSGVPDVVGRDAIAAILTPMLSQLRSSFSSATSRIYVRDQHSSFIHVQFVVTSRGCSGTYEQVSHIDWNSQGQIQRMELTVVGTSVTEWAEELSEDCGESKSASDAAAVDFEHAEGDADADADADSDVDSDGAQASA